MQGKSIHEKDVTLHNLLTTKIKEPDLSRSRLVLRMGYTNVSKALRRLDHFVQTLEAPSEEFIVRLRSALRVDNQEFAQAVAATLRKIYADAEKAFQPFLQVLPGAQIRPGFAGAMIYNLCCLPVPEELLDLPYKEEIDSVIALYQGHVEAVLSGNLKKHVIGFEYHREYNRLLRFNAELELEETVAVQPVAKGKILLGNRLANLLSMGG